jgi:hypothetical protein
MDRELWTSIVQAERRRLAATAAGGEPSEGLYPPARNGGNRTRCLHLRSEDAPTATPSGSPAQ